MDRTSQAPVLSLLHSRIAELTVAFKLLIVCEKVKALLILVWFKGIVVNEVKKSRSAESIKPITQQNKELKRVTDEIVVYTEDDLLTAGSDETRELYYKFKDGILNLADDIQVIANKQYIAFRKNRNIVCMNIQKKQIRMWIGAKWGALDDAKSLAIDVSSTGHWGTGDYEVNVTNDKDLEYIMSLIKQVL